jgi:ATP-dependent Lon protease
MEIIELPGYTLEEKLQIAKKHLVPKQLEAHGIAGTQVELADAALERIALGHTREAGVRTLEKRIADVCRSLAVEKVSGALPPGVGRLVTAAEIEKLLGPDKFENEQAERLAIPGVASGLAWTPAGGDVLFVEAAQMPGRGALILSGQLGAVMKESAQAAWSYVKANLERLGLAPEVLESQDFHVHVPAGATPKDGPSAGVTLFSALVSLLTGIKVRSDTAMTGEATLRGRVLPVGGIKEKVLAAHRMGYKRVLLPKRNGRDVAEIPEGARKELEIVLIETLDEALAHALEKSPLARTPAELLQAPRAQPRPLAANG